MKLSVLALLALILSACSSTGSIDSIPKVIPVDIASIPDAVPIYEPRTRAGNPGTYEVLGKHYTVLTDSKNYVKRGIASWYGTKFHGKKTSNGETYDMFAMTAAHKTLPIPCYARITNLQNQRSIIVRINDRGPFHDNRIIDLSYTAASKLGIIQRGTGFVEVHTLEPGQDKTLQTTGITPLSVKNLYLQVGAFSEQANAISLQNRIQAHQVIARQIMSLSQQGSQIHKVQVGPIKSVQEADNLTKMLAELGIVDSHLVIDLDP